MNETIQIRAQSKRNGLTITLISLLALAIVIFVLKLLAVDNLLVGYFFVAACLISTLVGIFKLREPEFSIELNDQGLIYNHIKGRWFLAWSEIQRCDVLSVAHGIDRQELPYVGLSIKHYTSLLNNISLRLASHLLNEQRNLLVLALKDDFDSGECPDGTCPSEAMFDVSEFKLDGQVYKGLIGMFANRIKKLKEKLGYELFIPVSAIDREPRKFVALLRQHQSKAQSRELS